MNSLQSTSKTGGFGLLPFPDTAAITAIASFNDVHFWRELGEQPGRESRPAHKHLRVEYVGCRYCFLVHSLLDSQDTLEIMD